MIATTHGGGNTPLHAAAKCGHTGVAAMLMLRCARAKALWDARNCVGETAADVARNRGENLAALLGRDEHGALLVAGAADNDDSQGSSKRTRAVADA